MPLEITKKNVEHTIILIGLPFFFRNSSRGKNSCCVCFTSQDRQPFLTSRFRWVRDSEAGLGDWRLRECCLYHPTSPFVGQRKRELVFLYGVGKKYLIENILCNMIWYNYRITPGQKNASLLWSGWDSLKLLACLREPIPSRVAAELPMGGSAWPASFLHFLHCATDPVSRGLSGLGGDHCSKLDLHGGPRDRRRARRCGP